MYTILLYSYTFTVAQAVRFHEAITRHMTSGPY